MDHWKERESGPGRLPLADPPLGKARASVSGLRALYEYCRQQAY